jgi:hypothetical protein
MLWERKSTGAASAYVPAVRPQGPRISLGRPAPAPWPTQKLRGRFRPSALGHRRRCPDPGAPARAERTCAIHESVSEKTRRRPLLTSEFSQNALRSSAPPNDRGRIRKPSRSLRCAGALRKPGDVPAKRHTRVDYKKKTPIITLYYAFENEGHGRIPSGSDSSIRVRVGRDVMAPPNSSGRGSMYGRRRCRCSCSSGSKSQIVTA